MRKYLLLFFVLILIKPCFASDMVPSDTLSDVNNQEINKTLLNDEEYKIKGRVEYDADGVLLLNEDDVEKMNIKINLPKKYPKKTVLSENDIFTKVEEQRKRENLEINEYLITPTFNSLEFNSGNFSYGTTFGTDMDSAQLEYRTKLFARYDNRFLGFMTAVGKDAYTSSGRQMSSIYLAPEIKLTKSFAIVDSFKINPDYERYRNDIILRYSPKIKNSRDIFHLEAGLGHTSYYTSGEQLYQFSLSTKFNF